MTKREQKERETREKVFNYLHTKDLHLVSIDLFNNIVVVNDLLNDCKTIVLNMSYTQLLIHMYYIGLLSYDVVKSIIK